MRRKIKSYKLELYMCILVIIGICYNSKLCVQATEYSSQKKCLNIDKYIEFDDIQNVINEANLNIDFKETVDEVVSGKDINSTFDSLNIKKIINNNINEHKEVMIKVIFVSLLIALFTNFIKVFESTYVSQTVFIVVYLVLVTILITSFYKVYTVAFNVLNILKNFMMVLMPVYTIASFISTGINTASGYSQLTMMIITCIEFVFLKVLLPLINVYMITNLINNINSVDTLKRLGEFLKMIVIWGLKISIILITGMGTVKKIIYPSIDTATKSIVNNSLKITPFIGGNISVVSDTITSATTLIKDAIGGVSLIVIGIICISPLLSIGVYIVLFKAVTILVESIADKRVSDALDSVSNSASLLLYVILASALLFTITIALLTV